jgi:hypothetical protein
MHSRTIRSPQGQRLVPTIPTAGYQTFRIQAPVQTHFRRASCEEYGCDAYRLGFRVSVDERTELGAEQARYIRRNSGRTFVESREGEAGDGLTVFHFPPGQTCFKAADHMVALEREPVFTVHRGDWRGMRLLRRHTGPHAAEDWRDDFGEHQDRLATAQERG